MKTIFILVIFQLILFAGYAQKMNDELWLEDLSAYQNGLEERHIDLYNQISRTDFENELEGIKALIRQKSDFEITIDLMRLTRKIGDGHTAISFRKKNMHAFPFWLKKFDESWRVIKVTEQNKHLLGQELVEIEGKNINEVAGKVGEVAQFVENRYSKSIRTAQYLRYTELMYGLGFTATDTEATCTFRNANGKLTTWEITGILEDKYENETFSELNIGVPEIVSSDQLSNKGFWYTPIKGTDGLYIHFETYPTFDEMMKIGEEIVGYIVQQNIRQLVIDMRNNGGGDLYTGLVLAYALNLADPVDWKSGVYVLCDNVTFSAATSNTALFRELLNAKIVGEPTGSNPTGYQDMDTFELPNSKLVVCYSKRFFRIQEEATSGVQPDVPLKYEWASFSQGRDNMLEWIVKRLKSGE